ncbi:MAG: DUF488 family protein [Acidimicrobiales bacterium]
MAATSTQRPRTIYSVGYEGLTLEQFLQRLAEHDVTTLVDVRMTAASRRPGFSKQKPQKALTAAGISYVHERDLDNPRDNRENFRTGDRELGRARMRARLKDGSGEALRRLVDLSRTERVAVLCVERLAASCHRQVVTEMACEIEPSLAAAGAKLTRRPNRARKAGADEHEDEGKPGLTQGNYPAKPEVTLREPDPSVHESR